MKRKHLIILLCFIMALTLSMAFIACGPKDEPDSNDTKTEMSIDLRSPESLDKFVGDNYKIVYRVIGSDNDVTFTSSNPEVATVDSYGNVKAVGVGEAVITLTLNDDKTITRTVKFNITKTFFIDKAGYRNGVVDLSTESHGYVMATSDQVQILVNERAEVWYFACHIDRVGANPSDKWGRWGIGSFRVDEISPIGDVMVWFGFMPESDIASEGPQLNQPYVGGWRIVTNFRDPEIKFGEIMDTSAGCDLALVRKGNVYYYSVTAGGVTYKYIYEVKALDGIPTYPGVYSQNQKLKITEFEATADAEEVEKILGKFQCAENISLRLAEGNIYTGTTYYLASDILPATTYDKSVTYSLQAPVEGVSLQGNVLTVSQSASGNVTLIATANSDTSVTDSKTYTITEKPATTSELFDTALVSGEAKIEGNAFNATADAKVPLNVVAGNWYVTFNVASRQSGAISLLSATSGETLTAGMTMKFAANDNRILLYGDSENGYSQSVYAPTGANYASYSVGMIKNGAEYYVIVNDRVVRVFTAAFSYDTMPEFVVSGGANVSDVTVTTDAKAIQSVLEGYKYYVGGYVTKDGNTYVIAAMDFGDKVSDINWPPVNDYENGIKCNTALKGEYTIEFTMSNIRAMKLGDGSYDGKVLIYLKSESRTSSLQFVIKGDDILGTELTFCPNLNDATWKEYAFPSTVNIPLKSKTEETHVKVVKTMYRVHLYINGVEVFSELNSMLNSDFWGTETPCTVGIGTFKCGVTIKDFTVTPGAQQ